MSKKRAAELPRCCCAGCDTQHNFAFVTFARYSRAGLRAVTSCREAKTQKPGHHDGKIGWKILPRLGPAGLELRRLELHRLAAAARRGLIRIVEHELRG